MRRPGRNTGIVLGLLAMMLAATDASARTERLRWQHADADIDSYRIYWGTAANSLNQSVAVTSPDFDPSAAGGQGAYFFDFDVDDAVTAYFAVTATKDGLESAKSNTIARVGIGEDPVPDPDPDPTPGGASAAIVGFALWNASNDTRVDADFVSGETIASSLSGCAAIEIRGNSYLQNGGAGSIKKVWNGLDRGCVSGDNRTFENSTPFVWENHTGSDFQCAPTLAVPGTHTLTVTPYDGDECSGAVGTPTSVTFTVESPTTGTPLGAPGQPYLVQ